MALKLSLTSKSPAETAGTGEALGRLVLPGDIYVLTGKLGAGKTCLARGIAWGLGIKENVASPSFVLIRELAGRLPFYHIDLYRLENTAEIAELGLDDYLYDGGVSVVEWGEKALPFLPGEYLLIEISYLPDNERAITISARGTRYRELLENLRVSLVGV